MEAFDVTDWFPSRNCPKCSGHGWLWSHELDEPVDYGDEVIIADDTKYTCDDECHKTQTADGDAWARERAIERLRKREVNLGYEILNRQDELAEVQRELADLQNT
jgi:hypothetical protein